MKLRYSLLSASLLSAGLLLTAFAQAQNTDTDARRQELAAARAELQRAAKRVAELSGRDGTTMAVERRIERRPVIGVLLAPDPEAGVRITGVTPDSGAAKAGLKAGDQLLRIDGKAIEGGNGEQRSERARAALADLKAGSPIAVTYRRAGREHTVKVTPEIGRPVMVLSRSDGGATTLDTQALSKRLHAELAPLAGIDVSALTLGVAPEVQLELQRLGSPDCEGKDCLLPTLTEAFRWNGLNLASLEPQLGRYFGTDSGVLVLSTGPELEGLQPGDVIRKVDGKAVTTPREVMSAFRGHSANSQVGVEYLRDRRSGSTRITIPEAMPLRFSVPAPPAPPAPPAAPKPPSAPHAGAIPIPPAAPRVVIIGRSGEPKTLYGRLAPPAAPAPPAATAE